MFKVGGQFEGWFITFYRTLKLTKQYNIILIYMRCFVLPSLFSNNVCNNIIFRGDVIACVYDGVLSVCVYVYK